jgi:hypothetical protein
MSYKNNIIFVYYKKKYFLISFYNPWYIPARTLVPGRQCRVGLTAVPSWPVIHGLPVPRWPVVLYCKFYLGIIKCRVGVRPKIIIPSLLKFKGHYVRVLGQLYFLLLQIGICVTRDKRILIPPASKKWYTKRSRRHNYPKEKMTLYSKDKHTN